MEFLLLLALPILGFAFSGSGHDDDKPDEPDHTGETLTGGDGSDTLLGTARDDQISGLGGDDSLIGNAGDDTISGSDGDDFVDGSAGDDQLYGGAGNDLVLGLSGDDSLFGGRGSDVMLGEEGNDQISLGSGNDVSWVDDEVSNYAFEHGQLGDDVVHGEAGNDEVWDYSGQNTLDGGDGNDIVSATDNQLDGWETAAQASDHVAGGAGDDLLIGDDGDTLTGGSGNDLMVTVHERDDAEAITVTDYDGNEDRLELDVDQRVADLSQWTLFSQTDADTGTVTVGLESNADPDQTIELAHLLNANNFAISQVSVFQF
ncbi:calcium-binding protein [Cypionkella sp.]|uniref:calcium-binding protein n=1 Tax=Cypionkella sp. TaxID=2811411 RepID=UPI0027163EAF|nr:calcium-binding protein [Cypionkella sp.]MDO8984092.1 calcium-binding protein [Cypionkella sp.]MDP2047766.1 calcium-binding protein [Cypionkella sp.]